MTAETFFSDIEFPDQYYGVLIRSTIERGHLVDIQPPKLPDGYFMYSATDIPGENRILAMGTSIPVFTPYEIQYIGEPLGIIVGPDPDVVHELVSEVLIETEKLEPYRFDEKFSSSQVVGKRIILKGDPESVLQHSAKVFETTSAVGPQDHFYAEPLGVNVHIADGKLEVCTATQWPFHVQSAVSNVLDLDPAEIVVRPTSIGEAMDGKLWFPSLLAAQAALAAVLCKKPVRIAFSRQEDFLFSVKSAPVSIRYRTAIDESGNLAAMNVRILINAGAYSPLVDEIVDRISIASAGLYCIPSCSIETFALRTNLPPMGALSGWGEAPAIFALETHISWIMHSIGVSPVEWNLMNTLTQGRMSITGSKDIGNIRYAELFSAVCTESDFPRKYAAYEYLNSKRSNYRDGPLRGIGIVCGFQGNGFVGKVESAAPYSVEITMDTDGIVNIKTGFHSLAMQQNLRALACDILGIEEHSIRFTGTDTAHMPPTGPDTLSSKIAIIAPLVEKCCQSIQKQRFRQPLPITVKKTWKAQKKDEWSEKDFSGTPFVSMTPGVCAVELELNPVTYEVVIRGIWLACDAGKLYNRSAAMTTIKKTVPVSLSRILTEHIVIKDGKMVPKNSVQYDMLQPSLIPDPWVHILESADEPKGIGSIAYNILPAAYAAALAQITGSPVREIPVDTHAVYEAIEHPEDAHDNPVRA
jgi:CO/xanthine dehydrogenase Mo-binding subunit